MGCVVIDQNQHGARPAAQDGAAGGVAEAQEHCFVVLQFGIVQDRDGEGGTGLSGRKVEDAAGRGVIGDAGGAVGGGVGDRDGISGGAETEDFDGGAASAFEDAEGTGGELEGAARGAAGALQADQAIAVEAIELGEVAAHQKVAVRLDPEGADGAVGAGAGGKGGVDCALGQEADEAVVGSVVEGGELAADQDLAVGLEGEGLDGVVGASADGQGVIQEAFGGQTGEVTAGGAVDLSEPATDQEMAVRLAKEGAHMAIGTFGGVEGRVQGAAGQQAGQPGAG